MIILVVDDEPTMPRLFAQRFRKEIRDGRLQFFYAATGEEALRLLAEEATQTALILSDINMPGMSGLELLDALKVLGWTRPIYMVSAYDGSDYEKRALEKGAWGFLAKPLRFDELVHLFENLPSEPV